MDVDHKSEMEDVLNKAGLSELLQRFIARKSRTTKNHRCNRFRFDKVGVATIGDRVRLREACRKREKEPHHSDTNDSSSRAFDYGDTSSARHWERCLLFHPYGRLVELAYIHSIITEKEPSFFYQFLRVRKINVVAPSLLEYFCTLDCWTYTEITLR